jgi:hypothetical protein
MFFPIPPRRVAIDGRPADDSLSATDVTAVLVGARFFETLGIAPLRGRVLTSADAQPGQEGVVIDERVATRLFPSRSPSVAGCN